MYMTTSPRALCAMVEGLACALDILANIYDNLTFIKSPPQEAAVFLVASERVFPIAARASLLLLPPALVLEIPAAGAQAVHALRPVAILS